jgi:hypothetical protein
MPIPCRVEAFEFSRGFQPTVSVTKINSVASATIGPAGTIQSSLRDVVNRSPIRELKTTDKIIRSLRDKRVRPQVKRFGKGKPEGLDTAED